MTVSSTFWAPVHIQLNLILRSVLLCRKSKTMVFIEIELVEVEVLKR
jgi:hypothetical protein